MDAGVSEDPSFLDPLSARERLIDSPSDESEDVSIAFFFEKPGSPPFFFIKNPAIRYHQYGLRDFPLKGCEPGTLGMRFKFSSTPYHKQRIQPENRLLY